MRARHAFGLATLILAMGSVAGAQALPRLDVTSFTFTSDTRSPAQEQPFHLIIDVHIRGRIDDLEGVVLPQLGTLEILGDEKHTTVRGDATEYRESIAVVAHRGGTIAIPPAYLDAIDARDGKPKRFLSDPLTLQVSGPAGLLIPDSATDEHRLRGLIRIGGFSIGALLIVALALLALGLRKAPVPIADAEVVEPEPVALSQAAPVDAMVEARRYLTHDPSRESALAARSALWHSIGAGDGETLADVVRRPAAHDPVLRAVLRALERAAFTGDDDRPAAIEDALRALDGYRA